MSTEITPTVLIMFVNMLVVAVLLLVGGWVLARGRLSVTAPSRRQVAGEAVLSFFVGKARGMAHGPEHDKIMRVVTPFLATLFLFILLCNTIAMFPFPVVNRPPTSYFSVTLGLALVAVGGTLVISGRVRGMVATTKHLFWPNPMQLISEITDVLSLSLRLFGNIAGEYMTILLVTAIVPFLIPLILHVLSVIPAFVQALVFTLLTASFLGNAISHVETKSAKEASQEARQTAVEAIEDQAGQTSALPSMTPALLDEGRVSS